MSIIVRKSNHAFNPENRSTPAYLFESAENRIRFYRHVSTGAWPFSTSAHGWPISDCTAEGLKAILALNKSKSVQDGIKNGSLKPMEDKRFFDAVNVLLTYQNEDGGKNQTILYGGI